METNRINQRSNGHQTRYPLSAKTYTGGLQLTPIAVKKLRLLRRPGSAPRNRKRKAEEQLAPQAKKIKLPSRYPNDILGSVLQFTLAPGFSHVWEADSFLPKEYGQHAVFILGKDHPRALEMFDKLPLVSPLLTPLFNSPKTNLELLYTYFRKAVRRSDRNSLRHHYLRGEARGKDHIAGMKLLITRLLKEDKLPSDIKDLMIAWIAYYGDTEMMKPRLKDPRFNTAEHLNLALRVALDVVNCPQMATLLINDPRTDPSIESNKALCYFVGLNDFPISRKLLQDTRVIQGLPEFFNWVDFDIHTASLEENMMLLLIQAAAPVIPLQDSVFARLLGTAAFRGWLSAANLLLEIGHKKPRRVLQFAVLEAARGNKANLLELLLTHSGEALKTHIRVALNAAAKYGHLPLLQQLLNKTQNTRKGSYNKAFEAACKAGHSEVVELLLRTDAVYFNSKAWMTLLRRNPKAAKRYIKEDDRIYQSLKQEGEPAALAKGHFELLEGFLKQLNDPSTTQRIFFQAIEKILPNAVELLLKNRDVDPSANNNLAICWAAEKGYSSIVKRLLKDERVDPAARDNYPIRAARVNDHIEIERMLETNLRVYTSPGFI